MTKKLERYLLSELGSLRGNRRASAKKRLVTMLRAGHILETVRLERGDMVVTTEACEYRYKRV